MRRQHADNRQQINSDIRYYNVRLIGDEGQLGVMTKDQALAIAEQRKKDLVVINEKTDPPIAKLLDANKYFYEQKRKKKKLQSDSVKVKLLSKKCSLG